MPEFEEYNIIIKELAENNALKQFVKNYYKLQESVLQLEGDTSASSLVGALHQPKDEQPVEMIGDTEIAGSSEL